VPLLENAQEEIDHQTGECPGLTLDSGLNRSADKFLPEPEIVRPLKQKPRKESSLALESKEAEKDVDFQPEPGKDHEIVEAIKQELHLEDTDSSS
jgi:hypothetical protein